ncbi:aspartate dehydrogenase [Bhargavaea cecembensis]|uniref:L-aspartate dehydrogenase n=1 Tax=Bhargavaea cecembensis TaxID=394098 RepID=A0A161RHJ4_9BACL|nr:aspartate dehydrogenase [Bhargavaea cecembensis]KZE37538.1 aspartate dehydrogenase [Bhargavaea cecembensis]
MNIGIMGTGNIADYLLKSINEERQIVGTVTAVFGRNREAGGQLEKQYKTRFYQDFDSFIGSDMDMVIEAAAVEVAAAYSIPVLENQKDLVVSSIGAFADAAFLETVRKTAEMNGRTVHLPSGAVGGLDLLKSANALGGLEKVMITTRKSPASLGLEGISEEKLLFDGPAGEAIKKFPKNVNVALALSLAGIGTEKTGVRVIADPSVERNTHTIEVEGSFGNMAMTIENLPMPGNPKTSYLAALSVLAALKNQGKPIVIG